MLVSHNFTCDNVYRALFNMEQMEPIITSITELVKASLNSNSAYPASICEQMILKSSLEVGRGGTLLSLSWTLSWWKARDKKSTDKWQAQWNEKDALQQRWAMRGHAFNTGFKWVKQNTKEHCILPQWRNNPSDILNYNEYFNSLPLLLKKKNNL